MSKKDAEYAGQRKIPSYALIYFLIITLAITWGIAGSYIVFPVSMAGWFGELEGAHPLYFLATWGPGIAGVTIVFAYGGRRSLRSFLARLLYWRCALLWWLLVLVGLPLAYMAGSLIKGGPLLAPAEDGFGQVIIVALVMLLLGPVEELGWRGVAQPILQRHVAPIWAGAIIGAVWGIWHLPAFYLSSTVYADWNFPLFMLGTVTLAVLVTPIFNASHGSLLLPILFHWQLIIPFWPDAQPWDTWILLGLTALIVFWKRDTMFSRENAVTEVNPQVALRS